MKLLFFLLTMFSVLGCHRTEDGLVLGRPIYEQRDIDVSEIDLKILKRADELLLENNWTKDSLRTCAEAEKLSLYCALEKASIDVTGEYTHRQAALQEVRFAIDEHYRSYWSKHRLGDFNGNKSTRFSDVKKVISVAISRVQMKLKHSKSIPPNANTSAD